MTSFMGMYNHIHKVKVMLIVSKHFQKSKEVKTLPTHSMRPELPLYQNIRIALQEKQTMGQYPS